MYFQTSERIFLSDGTEVLPEEAFPCWRECTALGHSLGWMEREDLLMLCINGDKTRKTYFIRSDGSLLGLRAEETLGIEPVLSVTLDGNVLGSWSGRRQAIIAWIRRNAFFVFPCPMRRTESN